MRAASPLPFPILLFVTALAGCASPYTFEGDEAGECTDDADNDRDGAFDCDDNDCQNSEACGEGDDDATGDDDSTADDDTVADDDTSADDDTAADDDTSADDDTAADDDTSTDDDTSSDDDTVGDDDSGDDDSALSPEGWDPPFFAPYVDATAYPIPFLHEISVDSGVQRYVLGFVVASSPTACDANWGTYYAIETGPNSWDSAAGTERWLYDEIDALRAIGGDVMVSFGGAANTPIEVPCPDTDSIVAQYLRVIDELDLVAIDFDIEGIWVADHAPGGSVDKRSIAIAALQDELAVQGRDVALWYTLPVLPSGLTPDGVAVLESAVDHGVELDGVNVMTMDYGDSAAPNPDGQMGDYAIDAITALHGQLSTLYSNAGIPKTDAELWAMVGATPMIGLNDVLSENFTISEAEELRTFADTEGVGMVSMWSMNRDHPCPESTQVQLNCSSTASQTADWMFSGTLGPVRGGP